MSGGLVHKLFIKERVAAITPQDLPFLIRTGKGEKRDKRGHWLVDIFPHDDGESLTEHLIAEFGDAV